MEGLESTDLGSFVFKSNGVRIGELCELVKNTYSFIENIKGGFYYV